jgi:hypothetical protein
MAANQLRAVHACIGFTNGSNDNIIDAQGVDSVRELGCLNNEDAINLCKTIRCPGGHLPNPAFVAGGIMNPMIPCPGVMVPNTPKTTCSWLPALSDITSGSVEPPTSLR